MPRSAARSSNSATASCGASDSTGTSRSPDRRRGARLVADTQVGTCGEQPRDKRRGVEQVLEVVQHEQQRAVAGVRGDGLLAGLARVFA